MKRTLWAAALLLASTVAAAQAPLKVFVGRTGTDATGEVITRLYIRGMSALPLRFVELPQAQMAVHFVTMRAAPDADRSVLSAAFVIADSYVTTVVVTCPPSAVVECAQSLVDDTMRVLREYASPGTKL